MLHAPFWGADHLLLSVKPGYSLSPRLLRKLIIKSTRRSLYWTKPFSFRTATPVQSDPQRTMRFPCRLMKCFLGPLTSSSPSPSPPSTQIAAMRSGGSLKLLLYAIGASTWSWYFHAQIFSRTKVGLRSWDFKALAMFTTAWQFRPSRSVA